MIGPAVARNSGSAWTAAHEPSLSRNVQIHRRTAPGPSSRRNGQTPWSQQQCPEEARHVATSQTYALVAVKTPLALAATVNVLPTVAVMVAPPASRRAKQRMSAPLS